MRIAATFGSGPPRVLSQQSPSRVTGFCWHPTLNEAFVGLLGGSILRVNGETGSVFGEPLIIPKAKVDVSNDAESEEVSKGKQKEVTEEGVVFMNCDTSAGNPRHLVLNCITNSGRLISYEVNDDRGTVDLIGECKLKLQLDPYSISATSGLECSALFGLAKRASHSIQMIQISPQFKKRKFGTLINFEAKESKPLKGHVPMSICCANNVPAVAVAMLDGSLQIWRFSQADVQKELHETLSASSFVISPSLDHQSSLSTRISPLKRAVVHKSPPGCVVWANHDDRTRLVIVHREDVAEATVWAWSALKSNDSDGGVLCRIRTLTTTGPDTFVQMNPLVPVAICLSPSSPSTPSRLSLVDVESGAQIGDGGGVPFQSGLLPTSAARPPQQNRPKPPPRSASPSKSTNQDGKLGKDGKKTRLSEKKLVEGEKNNETQGKRRRSRFSFIIPGSASKKRSQFPEQIHISAPIVPPSLSAPSAEQDKQEHDSGSMETRPWVHVSPVTGSIVVVEKLLDSRLGLFARELFFSWESSFQSSATVPLVSFPSSRSGLAVRFAPQALDKLPMGDATGSTMYELVLERIGLGNGLKLPKSEQVILKKPQTPFLTIIGLTQRVPLAKDEPSGDGDRQQIILRAVGSISLLPFLGFSRTAVFEPAADCCFFIAGKVAIVTQDRSSIVVKKFDEGKSTWERCSFKISLQYDLRRVFSTPFRLGGIKKTHVRGGTRQGSNRKFSMADRLDDDDDQDNDETEEVDEGDDDGEWEGSVLLYCGLLRPGVEFLCYSRNVFGSPYGEEDLFMLLPDGVAPREERASSTIPPTAGTQQQLVNPSRAMIKRTLTRGAAAGLDGSSGLLNDSQTSSPPLPPMTGTIATHYRGGTLHRAGSVAITVSEMDELRLRQKSLDREKKNIGDDDEGPGGNEDERGEESINLKRSRVPFLLFERGEKVVDAQWSRFQKRTAAGDDFSSSKQQQPADVFWTTSRSNLERLAVFTTRRVMILDHRLQVLAEAREVATSLVWTSPDSVVFSSPLKSYSQLFVLSIQSPTEAPPLMTCLNSQRGPVVCCEAFPRVLVCASIDLQNRDVHLIPRPIAKSLREGLMRTADLRVKDVSDWSVKQIGALAGESTRLKVLLSHQRVPLMTKTRLDLGTRRLGGAEVSRPSLALVRKRIERTARRCEDPEFRLPQWEADDLSGSESPIELVLTNKFNGDYWAMFESCVVLMESDRVTASRYLLDLAKHVRGAGSSALIQAIKTVLGDEVVMEAIPTRFSAGSQRVSSNRYREDSVASQAAQNASFRSEGSSSRSSLKRRETLPHPEPSASSQSSRLPMSVEGRVVFDEDHEDDDADEHNLKDLLAKQVHMSDDEDDDDDFDPSKFMYRRPNGEESSNVLGWFTSNLRKGQELVHFGEDYLFDDDEDDEEEDVAGEKARDEEEASATKSLPAPPLVPGATAVAAGSKHKKEFDALQQVMKTRRLSFGGSEEGACVGYWRFVENRSDKSHNKSFNEDDTGDEDDSKTNPIVVDLSRFSNNGTLFGEDVELVDTAESCTRLEMGGRRRPHALRCGEEGGMFVPVSESLDLGPHQEEMSRRSFTCEFWLRRSGPISSHNAMVNLVRRSCSVEAEEDEWVWRWSLLETDGSLQFEWKKPDSQDIVSWRSPRLDVLRQLGDWNHLALVVSSVSRSTTEEDSGDEEDEEASSMKVTMFVNAEDVDLNKFISHVGGGDSMEEEEGNVIHFGGESLFGELLEMRFWAIARERDDIESGMETYLNLADRIAIVKTSPTTTQTSSSEHRPSLSLPPPPSAPSSRRPTAASLFNETFDAETNPFDSKMASGNTSSIVGHGMDAFEPAWNFDDPQKTPTPTKAIPSTSVAFDPFDPFAQISSMNDEGDANLSPSLSSSVIAAVAQLDPFALPARQQSQQQQQQQPTAQTMTTKTGGTTAETDPWRRIVDEETGTEYFFNTSTGVSVWTDPRVSDSPWDALQDEFGSTYYYNRITGETTWENPDDFDEGGEEERIANNNNFNEREAVSNVDDLDRNTDDDGIPDGGEAYGRRPHDEEQEDSDSGDDVI